MNKLVIMLLMAVILPGCAVKAPFTSEEILGKVQQHFALAQQYEKHGELKKALIHYKIAANLDTENEKSKAGVARLADLIEKKAAEHFERAKNLQSQNKLAEARKEFIRALWYDGDNTAAWQAIKERPDQTSWQTYVVKKGDTLDSIAEKTLGTSKKAFIIASLNELQTGASPPAGSRLIIPQWDEARIAPKPKVVAEPEVEEETAPEAMAESVEEKFVLADEIAAARQHVHKKRFEDALAVITEIKRHAPDNQEVSLLEETTYCEFSKRLAVNKDFARADEYLEKVSSTSPCFADASKVVRKYRQEEAQRLYLLGVNYYINENLQEAIDTWGETLAIDPGHEKAKADMEKAINLLEKYNQVK